MRIDYVGLLASLNRLPHGVLHILVALAVGVPLLAASRTKLVPSEETMAFHRAVQAVGEGETVLLATDLNSGTAFELEPMLTTLVTEVFSRGGRLLVVSLDAQGVGLVEAKIAALADAAGKEYGTDWVFLGFRPSIPAVVLSLASAPYTVFPKDHHGHPLSSMPLTERLSGFGDYRLVAVIATGPSAQEWVIYGHGRYQAPLVVGLGGGIGPAFQSFLSTKTIAGLIAGLRGAAEYEVAAGRPAEALRALSSQSFAHLLLVAFVILGNAAHFAASWRERTPL